MAAVCPKCRSALQLDQIPLKKDVQAVCPSCHSTLNVSLMVALEVSAGAPPSGSGKLNEKKVLVAVDGDATNEMIGEILSAGGFELITAADHQDILKRMDTDHPAIAIVDVGLPHVMGFQIAEIMRKRPELKDVGIILLASIHDATKYKREPDSLYGADDYIERHHIQDHLLGKIGRILESRRKGEPLPHLGDAPAPPPEPLPDSKPVIEPRRAKKMEEAMTIERVFEDMLEEERSEAAKPGAKSASAAIKVESGGDPAAHEAAKRLARLIISDIALYNQKAVDEGVRNGTFYDLLKNDIAEGKKLYEGRVTPDIVSGADYYREAIEDFIQKRKSVMK